MAILGQFQFRRDVASAWTTVNPILLDGELGVESDTDLFKLGDGVIPWNDLPYGGLKGDQGNAGRSIVSVQRTAGNGAEGTVDTYTITYSEAPLTSTFEVRNGADGISPTVTLATTTVVNPNVNPSVTDLDAGPNAQFRFSLPRAATLSVAPTTTVTPATAPSVARATNAAGDVTDTFSLPRAATLSVGATNTVTPVTNPSVSRATNAAGDVTDTFNLPRARNVTAGTTTTGNAGTTATVQSVQNGDGDVTLNFTIPRGDVGQTGPAANSFTNIAVTGQTTVVADQASDTLTLAAGSNISITTDAATDTVTISSTATSANAFGVITGNTGTATADAAADTLAITGGTGISTTVTDTPDGLVITNTDTGSAARTAHEAAADPHPQYTTTAEAAAAAPVQSVNGQTGNVTVTAGTDNTAVTRSTPTASASTVLTTIQSKPIAAGEITAGSEYDFKASLRVINTTAASNAVVTLSVGATNVLVLTQAIGTTAAATPGKPVKIEGTITFSSPTQAECNIRIFTSTAVAFDTVINTTAPITVAAAGATTIDLKFNTSAATSTFIARQATIQRVK